MFQFPGSAPIAGCHAFSVAGCPIRTPADRPLFAGPRSFSQLTASFFASESLGIPHTPFLTSLHATPMCVPRAALGPPCFANSLTNSFSSMSMNPLPACGTVSFWGRVPQNKTAAACNAAARWWTLHPNPACLFSALPCLPGQPRLDARLSSSADPPANGPASPVENIGFEPMTPCLQSRCSSQLS